VKTSKEGWETTSKGVDFNNHEIAASADVDVVNIYLPNANLKKITQW